MQEFGFELALCRALERERPDRLYARQLGGAVRGRRVVDIVAIEPGPEFDTRRAITSETIPPLAAESDVGPGTAVRPADAFDCHPERARAAVDRAVELGFFQRTRRNGHTAVRQTTRYPDWFDSLVAVENKPDLERPGDLRDQLRTDASLGLFDEVVLATESYVTRAHLNRLPDVVGVWRFDPESGERAVVREARQLPVAKPGIELVERHAGRADIRPVDPEEKARVRRRVAERVYGKGWRPELPACGRCVPGESPVGRDVEDAGDHSAGDALPWCPYYDRFVRPAADCGPDCTGYDPSDPPDVDRDALRARHSPWDPDPEDVQRQQVGLDSFD